MYQVAHLRTDGVYRQESPGAGPISLKVDRSTTDDTQYTVPHIPQHGTVDICDTESIATLSGFGGLGNQELASGAR